MTAPVGRPGGPNVTRGPSDTSSDEPVVLEQPRRPVFGKAQSAFPATGFAPPPPPATPPVPTPAAVTRAASAMAPPLPVSAQDPQPQRRPWRSLGASLRGFLAAILDVFTIFGLAGYLVARFTGGLTETGFTLEGRPALVVFLIVAAYFILGPRLGGTLWQRILRAGPAAR